MIHQHPIRRSLVWLAFLTPFLGAAHAQLLGGPGGGEGSGAQFPPQETFSLATPASESTGTFTRTCTGDFDADFSPDFATIQGGKVLLSGAPAGIRYWVPTQIQAQDLATHDVPGTRDRFVTVGTNAVEEHVITSAGTITSTPLETSGVWTNAMLVDVGRTLDQSEFEDRIVGVLSDARSVEILSPSAGGWITTPLAWTQPITEDAIDLALSDVDGNQELEIVIATRSDLPKVSSLFVYELDGTRRMSYSFSGHSATSLSVGKAGTGMDWLAWTSRKNGTDRLLAIDQNGIACLANLGNLDIVGAATVGWAPGSETSDLALSLAGIDELWVLTNVGAARPVLSLNDYTIIQLGESAGSNLAHPTAADVDLDGDEDLFLPMQASENVVISRNADEDHVEQGAEVVHYPDGLGELQVLPYCEGTGGGSNPYYDLLVSVNRPPDGPASQANAIGYAVWKQAEQANEVPANWTTAAQAVLPQHYAQPFVGNNMEFTVEIPEPDNSGCGESGVISGNIYYIELQLVEMDAGFQNVLNAFPTKLIGIQTESIDPSAPRLNYEYILNTMIPNTGLTISYEPGPDAIEIGSAGEMTELPNLVLGQVPAK